MATKGKSARIPLDDTVPLNCIVDNGEKVQDHVVSITQGRKVAQGLGT